MTHPDNSGPTFADVKTYARNQLRLAFGTDRIPYLEAMMAKAVQQLTEFKAAFTDFVADVDARLDQFIAAQGELQPDAQAIFDDLKASVQAADARVGDADNSDAPVTPPVEEPTEPTEPHTPTGPGQPV